ncbi:hypothetical protein HBI69_023830 [Parastagonospora nodorum]|nr:hypothetical protein HBI69_023830 [Parastagonospora nodorum]
MTLISNEYKTLYAENSLLQSTAPNSRLRTITHLATKLRNNNGYAKAVVYSAGHSLNYTQFIRTLKREVEFKDKRSSIYYYIKTADTCWHSALQDTVATKLYRATFVIELLI